MAPNSSILVNSNYTTTTTTTTTPTTTRKPPRLSMESLQRTISDISFELSKEAAAATAATLPPISEVEDAACECCGMREECTPEYISSVRRKFSGKLICGLCGEAVKEEMEKNGGKGEEALNEHMSACVRFNRFGRVNPVLYQAQAMKQMLRNSSRAKSLSPRDYKSQKKGGIARSSSCIPAITKEMTDLKLVN